MSVTPSGVPGGCTGALAPLVGSAILADSLTWTAWRTVFWLVAVIYVVGNCFYVWLVRGEPQWWDSVDEEEEVEGKEMVDRLEKEEVEGVEKVEVEGVENINLK